MGSEEPVLRQLGALLSPVYSTSIPDFTVPPLNKNKLS